VEPVIFISLTMKYWI